MIILVAAAATLAGCGEEFQPPEPRIPSVFGRVVDVDSPERVDNVFLGDVTLTLVDGSTLEVPRGATYRGPNCPFIDDRNESPAFQEGRTECAINAVVSGNVVTELVGLRLTEDGRARPPGGGDIVQVNRQEQYVATQFGEAFVWRDEPAFSCDLPIESLDDPALIEHRLAIYILDTDGYLVEVRCAREQ